MKTNTMLAAASFLLTACLAVAASRAEAADGSGVWEGPGTAYGSDGVVVGRYAVTFSRRQDGNKVRVEGKAILADGKEVPFWEEDETEGNTGFRIASSDGPGHGGCFGNGICQTYKHGANGRAVATTFVIDSADAARIQQTEYENEQIVQYREATLKRK
jgi:hypothetical protein